MPQESLVPTDPACAGNVDGKDIVMEVRVEDAGGCRKVLHIEVPEDAVSPEYRGVLKEYSHAARIPGFRKGKAPENVVEKRYEAEIHQDTKDRLVPRAYREALDSRGIRPVAIIEVSDVELEKGRGLTFKATVDVAPDFKLPRYRKIALRGEKHDVADKDVEDALQRTRERFGRFEDVEGREVREGDLVNVDYSGTIDGSPVSDIAPDCRGIGGGTDFWALAGDPEFLPGFAKGIAGAAIGDVKTMDVVFSHDYHVASVAGRNAVYEFTVKALRERRIPELDEEFLKRMGAESVEDLRQKIREELETAGETAEKERLKGEIARHLLGKTRFDSPQSLVEQKTNAIARDIVQRMAMQGGTREQIEARRDDILNTAQQSSADRVKLGYILDRIADEEGIETSGEDLDERLNGMAARYGVTVERLRAEMEQREAMDGIKSEVRAAKTLDFLLENAKVKK